ncbi:MAG: hypothetical protein ACO1N3_04155 [Gammaproteobacteria bacterium]
MLALGPIAYHNDQRIHWLQIIIGDSGICSEIKQASETEIVTDTWKTLDPSQWPSTIPVYDPVASQSNYILTRSAENKICKHMVSKVNLPQSHTADGQNPPPIYRVSSQTYSKTHIGAPTLIKDQEQKAALVAAFWSPNAEEQERLKGQYQQWEQGRQATIWHHEEGHPELDMPNLPLDFKATQSGKPKTAVNNTDLNQQQQWIVQSIITDNLSDLKKESASSTEYAAALLFLMDGTQPETPFTEATIKNIEEVKKISSAVGINRYMSNNFYTKIYKNASDPNAQENRVALTETDPGYTANIQSVIFYIQQLLQAEILQFFPKYTLKILEQAPVTLLSSFKLGTLPANQAGAIEESSSSLSRQEIRQIDDVYRVLTGTYPWTTADDHSLNDLYTVIDSMHKRLAITSAVATTIRLIIPSSDSKYESSLEIALDQIQIHRQIKKLFIEILTSTHAENSSVTSLSPQEIKVLSNNLPIIIQYIQSSAQDQQYALLIALYQKRILSKDEMIKIITNLSQKNPNIRNELANSVLSLLKLTDNESYKRYYEALANDISFDLNTPAELVENLSYFVDFCGPRTADETQFLEWTDILVSMPGVWPNINRPRILREKIDQYNIAKPLHDLLSINYSPEKEIEILAIIPEITANNLVILSRAFRSLSEDYQTILIRTLLHHRAAAKLQTLGVSDLIKKMFNPNAIAAAVAEETLALPPNEQIYFSLLQSVLTNAINPESFTYELLIELQTALNATFPIDNKPSKIFNLLKMTTQKPDEMSKLTNLHETIQGRLLEKKLSDYFNESQSTDSQQKLNALIPNLEYKTSIDKQYENSKNLNIALNLLSSEQQTEILLNLFNNQSDISDTAIKELFGEQSVLKFTTILDVMNTLNTDQRHLVFNRYTVMFVIRNLFSKYKEEFPNQTKEFLRDVPEEILDKLMPQISDQDIQNYLDNYKIKLQELPQAHTTEWRQTAEIISKLFAKTKTKSTFIQELATATSPKALKSLLLREIAEGYIYNAEYMVAIAIKRLNEHEAAIVNNLSTEERKQHLQLKSAGELGSKLALEIECLQAVSNGARKLQRIKNALNHLPEKLSSAELHAELRNKTSPLAQAVYSPIAPTARGFTFFTAKKLPEPDFAFLKEMDAYLDKMDETLSTKIRPKSTESRL